jgi:polyisoprenoid-binding protein YceI
MLKPLASCTLLALSLLSPAHAAERTLSLDPAACRVGFSLQATLHVARGTLPVKEGEIRFDLETGRASGRVVLDASQATTANRTRDEKMRGEVLETARYPEIVFVPAEVRGEIDGEGNGKVALTGTLSIHGSGHPFTVSASIRVRDNRLGAEGTFAIPYVEWGMKDPSVFLLRVSKEVEVHFEAAGGLSAASANSSAR